MAFSLPAGASHPVLVIILTDRRTTRFVDSSTDVAGNSCRTYSCARSLAVLFVHAKVDIAEVKVYVCEKVSTMHTLIVINVLEGHSIVIGQL